MENYSNIKASKALIKASLQSILKSPSAIVFTLAFPLIFILVFGFIGTDKVYTIPVALASGADKDNPILKNIEHLPTLKWKQAANKTAEDLLADGEVIATIAIRENPIGYTPRHTVFIHSSNAKMQEVQQLKAMLKEVIASQDPELVERTKALAAFDISLAESRKFTMIDFILPGQLGFSLLASGVFGTAFVFFNMRQTLVLKRFFATPVRKGTIVVSEGIARLTFQILGTVIIISIGHFCFNFTLVHGIITFLNMLLMCALGMMVFMGFGFIVSSIAKTESTIPPLANLITLPQFLLAGTFFTIDNFPKWLQPFCNILPLTYLNDALRKIAFDGYSIWEVRTDVAVLLIWGIIVYGIASRIFKWE